MRRIDELHLAHPFFGSRRLARMLQREGVEVGRLHVATLMRLMGIEAIYRKKRTTIPAPGHKIYPYLLRDVLIERPNQVWSTDITYIPMRGDFLYLVAVMDWFSRFVTAWRLSNTLSVEFCLEAVQETLDLYGCPEIFNTDQGSQFTCEKFLCLLKENNIQISMDGKGRALDNVFVERLWRTVKYEHIYLFAHKNGFDLFNGLSQYFGFYNTERKHQSLNNRTPSETFFT